MGGMKGNVSIAAVCLLFEPSLAHPTSASRWMADWCRSIMTGLTSVSGTGAAVDGGLTRPCLAAEGCGSERYWIEGILGCRVRCLKSTASFVTCAGCLLCFLQWLQAGPILTCCREEAISSTCHCSNLACKVKRPMLFEAQLLTASAPGQGRDSGYVDPFKLQVCLPQWALKSERSVCRKL